MKRTFVTITVIACFLGLQAKLDTAVHDERRHHEQGHNKGMTSINELVFSFI